MNTELLGFIGYDEAEPPPPRNRCTSSKSG